MATIIRMHGHSHLHGHNHARVFSTESNHLVIRYKEIIRTLDSVYFGFISMVVLIGSCIGGIAVMYTFEYHAPMWQILIGVTFSMMNNIAAIVQLKTKWVFNIFILNILINSTLILINAF